MYRLAHEAPEFRAAVAGKRRLAGKDDLTILAGAHDAGCIDGHAHECMAAGHVLHDRDDFLRDAAFPCMSRAGGFLEEPAFLCRTAVLDGRAADVDDSICVHSSSPFASW